MDKNNRKLKIGLLYKRLKADSSAYGSIIMLHKYSSPNRSKKKKKEPNKRAYLSGKGGLRKTRSGEWAKSRKG